MHHHHHHHRTYASSHHHQQHHNGMYAPMQSMDSYGPPMTTTVYAPMQHHHHQHHHHSGQQAIISTPPPTHHHHHHYSQHYAGPPPPAAPPASYNIKVHVENCSYPINRDVLDQIFSRVAPPLKIDCGPSGQVTLATVSFSDGHSAQRAISELNNKQIYPNCCRMTLSLEPPTTSRYPPQPAYAPYDAHHHHHQGGAHHHHHHHQHHVYSGQPRGRGRGSGAPPSQYGSPYAGPPAAASGESSVVIISGVPETISLHALWVLLEVYGNVNSLKRQYSQKENVVAQFQNIYDARGVVGLLHGCPFYGSLLGLKHFAGYVERGAGKTEWNAGPAEDPATQAVLFTSGFHHRTKPSAPYNSTQKAKPDAYLFISNLTDGITEENVRELFRTKGFEIITFYRKSPVAAMVALENAASAVEALIATHAVTLQERFLRVSFSRYPPGPPPSGAVFDAEQ